MSKEDLSKDLLDSLISSLKHVKDPRVEGRVTHLLIDVIVISVVGTLCGAEGVRELYQFAHSKQSWLKQYLQLSNGIPSEDTIARVLSIIDPLQMEKAFLDWVEQIQLKKSKAISLDGKYTKGTDRTFNRGTKPLLVVSAYSHEDGLVLFETEGNKGDELEAAYRCLEVLDLEGVLVDVDAGIGSSGMVHEIISRGGDYIVPLKNNKKLARNEVIDMFEERIKEAKTVTSNEAHHGRAEHRACWVLDVKNPSELFQKRWPKAQTIIGIVRMRASEDKRYVLQETGPDGKQSYRLNTGALRVSEEVTYYVTSRKFSAQVALDEVRRHWSIENKVHWVLDVAFREDDCRVRAKRLAKTLSLIRKIALNIIRKSNTKGSVKVRMKKAAWNNNFLDELLFAEAF